MDLQGELTINNVIIHIMNSKEHIHRLSDYEVVIDNSLERLIKRHITGSIKNETRRYAKFGLLNNSVMESCLNIFSDISKFVHESKVISDELYSAMLGTNASSANFLVIKYIHGDQNAIALLKLDFNDNFYTDEITQPDGTVKIEVTVKAAGFNEKQKLQKCAFIYESIIQDPSSPIIILDKQAKDDVTNYFGDRFLKASLFLDDRVNTTNMIDETYNFINAEFINDPVSQLEKSFQLSEFFKNNDEFNIDEMLNKVFDKEEIRQEFKDTIGNKELDFEFKIDDKRVERKLNLRHLVTNNGITLKANASLFNSGNIDIALKADSNLVDIIIKGVRIVKNK